MWQCWGTVLKVTSKQNEFFNLIDHNPLDDWLMLDLLEQIIIYIRLMYESSDTSCVELLRWMIFILLMDARLVQCRYFPIFAIVLKAQWNFYPARRTDVLTLIWQVWEAGQNSLLTLYLIMSSRISFHLILWFSISSNPFCLIVVTPNVVHKSLLLLYSTIFETKYYSS